MKALYRSKNSMRRVYLRWETPDEVGFSFTEHGRTYRSDRVRFLRLYREV